MRILQTLNALPTDLTVPLDGRNASGVLAGWNRLTLLGLLATSIEAQCKRFTEVAPGLPDLARLTLNETSSLSEMVARAHDMRRAIRTNQIVIVSAGGREGALAQELARRGQL